ncbi:hypothetical protein GRF59_05795 [Paenibacillus sp. HJL G12]|uniref:Uncharacterized protein n=1 Tax=Paenibacillus dendrobii TaxID=2691084 RepID=A0A7X3IFV2_9BACL|nr:DUF6138 family protein [Paenibacillus dendrobii]MWV43137.1 hypothetical protein [Paenibacillus dendrobii]
MNEAAKAFLQHVWIQITDIYDKENKRISELPKRSMLQAGIRDYLRVAWRRPERNDGYGHIYIDVDEPFDWSDSSYKSEAGPYIEQMTEEIWIREFFPALLERVENMFLAGSYSPVFFDYRFELVLEYDRDDSVLHHSMILINEDKRQALKERMDSFIQVKIMPDLPVLPDKNDEFFFARNLMNPDLFEQKQECVDPLIQRLRDKLRSNRNRAEGWAAEYTSAFKGWAEERFLNRYFVQSGNYGLEWALKGADEREELDSDALEFFIYAALRIGATEPKTRQQYLELAVQLGSENAAAYLKQGSGRFESARASQLFQGNANDILQTIDIRILSEEEAAYGEALQYITDLLKQGFPKGYKLTLKSKAKQYLPVKKMAKSHLHQFFGNALGYPALYPRIAQYAELAMEPFAWYGDVEPGEKSVMPGTYAIFGLGLYTDAFDSLVLRYMKLVDTEHQSLQDSFAEAYIDAHGLTPKSMGMLVSILLGSSESAKPLKSVSIDRPELAEVVLSELADKEMHEREHVLYMLFGSRSKLMNLAKKAAFPLKDKLEQMLDWIR